MITEDYVSLETAKHLKEKGFDSECDYLYVNGKILKGSNDIIHTIYAKDTYEEVCESAIRYFLKIWWNKKNKMAQNLL